MPFTLSIPSVADLIAALGGPLDSQAFADSAFICMLLSKVADDSQA
jgi:hypothetical protein